VGEPAMTPVSTGRLTGFDHRTKRHEEIFRNGSKVKDLYMFVSENPVP